MAVIAGGALCVVSWRPRRLHRATSCVTRDALHSKGSSRARNPSNFPMKARIFPNAQLIASFYGENSKGRSFVWHMSNSRSLFTLSFSIFAFRVPGSAVLPKSASKCRFELCPIVLRIFVNFPSQDSPKSSAPLFTPRSKSSVQENFYRWISSFVPKVNKPRIAKIAGYFGGRAGLMSVVWKLLFGNIFGVKLIFLEWWISRISD